MDFQTSEAYKCYNTRNSPDDKLPPLDFQAGGRFVDGILHLVPGEVFCRWREDISGVLCIHDDHKTGHSLRQHYERVHGAKLAQEYPTQGEGNQARILRWYADIANGLLPSWPRSVQVAQLAGQDLPRGNEANQMDYQSAVRLTRLFNEHGPDMPSKVSEELRRLLIDGVFQHKMAQTDGPESTRSVWRCLIMIETLQQECKGIVNAVLARCGDELDKSLAYKHTQTTANHTSVLDYPNVRHDLQAAEGNRSS
ncbi:hypothetical protein DER44DRAFT_901250 [Fusarium oxysporum]|nr:hypothetical protein DER44DRAFT_901250 [Fusarium oxysporum]